MEELANRMLEEEARQAAKNVEQIYGNISSAVIKVEADYICAGDLLREVATKKKIIVGHEKSILDPLNLAAKNTRNFFGPLKEVCDKARKYIESARSEYRSNQEKTRREEEDRLRALADKEQERLRKKAEKRAERAIEKGDEEKAQEIIDSVPVIAAPVLADAEIPKQHGVKVRKIWKFRVVDEAKVPRDWLVVDEKGLGAFARATKGARKVPGVEFYSEDSEAVSGK